MHSIEALGIAHRALWENKYHQEMMERIANEGLDASEVNKRVDRLYKDLTPERAGSGTIGRIAIHAPYLSVLEELCRLKNPEITHLFHKIVRTTPPANENQGLEFLKLAENCHNRGIRDHELSIILGVISFDAFVKILPSLNHEKALYLMRERQLSEEQLLAFARAESPMDWKILRMDPSFDLKKWDNAPVESPAPPHFFTVQIENWDNGILYGKRGEEGQRLYGTALGMAVAKGAELLRQEGDISLLIALAARERWKIAIDLRHYSYNDFGKTRPPSYEMRTPLVGRYENLKNFFSALSPEELDRFDSKRYSKKYRRNSVNFSAKLPGRAGQFSLMKIELTDDPMVVCSETNATKKYIYHTCQNVEPIIGHVKDLLNTALSTNITDEEALSDLGRAFWWICQAKPWYRGDPSIAEIVVKSIMLKRGIELMPWKEGIIPWAEVIKTPDPVEFGNRFSTLFQGAPPLECSLGSEA